MKSRIIGTVILAIVLAAVFILTQDTSTQQVPQPASQPGDIVYQPFKLN